MVLQALLQIFKWKVPYYCRCLMYTYTSEVLCMYFITRFILYVRKRQEFILTLDAHCLARGLNEAMFGADWGGDFDR